RRSSFTVRGTTWNIKGEYVTVAVCPVKTKGVVVVQNGSPQKLPVPKSCIAAGVSGLMFSLTCVVFCKAARCTTPRPRNEVTFSSSKLSDCKRGVALLIL